MAIVGCGGLGSIAAPYLAGAGVGHLTLIDADIPDVTNLHRQVFFQEGESNTKAQALAIHIQKLNTEIEVVVVEQMLTKINIKSILGSVDVVIECTDDMMTKYLVNDYCHLNGIAMVYGAIYKFDGYVSLFENKNKSSIQLRDIFPEPDLDVPSCSDIGVLNTIAGVIGLLQANEAIKYILNIGESLKGKLLTYNALTNDQLKLKLKKNWTGNIETLYSESNYESIYCLSIPEISFENLKSNIDGFNVISILEHHEHHDIFMNVKHMPLSLFDISNWVENTKPSVFYCMSGKRSSLLVEKLLKNDNSLNVYSLQGGLNNVPAT